MSVVYLLAGIVVIGGSFLVTLKYFQTNYGFQIFSPIQVSIYLTLWVFLADLVFTIAISFFTHDNAFASMFFYHSVLAFVFVFPFAYFWILSEGDALRSITDNIAECLFIVDQKGIIRYSNSAIENKFGYNIKELIGKPLTTLMPLPYSDEHDDYLKRYLETGEKHMIGVGRDVECLRKNGEKFPAHIEVNEIKKNSKKYFMGIIQDISLQKEHDRLLRIVTAINEIDQIIVRETDASLLLSQVCNVMVDTRDYDFIWIGRMHEKSSGMHIESYAGNAIDYLSLLSDEIAVIGEANEPDNPIYYAIKIKKVVITDITTDTKHKYLYDAKSHGFAIMASIPLISADRVFGVINVYSKERAMFDQREIDLLWELGDDIAFALNAIEDKKQRVLSEAELARSREAFQKFFVYNPNPCAITKLDGTIVYVNAEAVENMGYSESELIGKNTKDLSIWVNPDDREKMLLEIAANSYVDNFPTQYRIKDGRILDILYSAQLIDISGEKHLLTIIQNVTQQKKMEKELIMEKDRAEAANRAKSEFLSNMSHEIRTPLNSIIGMGELLGETAVDNEQKYYIAMLHKSGEHLLGLVNDLLDMSDIEAGKISLEQKVFKISDILGKIEDAAFVNAKEKGINISYTVADDVPQYVSGDFHRLTQVLENLFNNAVKFTDEGEISINVRKHISANTLPPARLELLFEVKDTGIGIPKEKLEAIFNNFTQVDSSVQRKYGGLGLGLTISKKLVELMGGRIWVESKLGEGSKFCFTAVFSASSYTDLPGDTAMQAGLPQEAAAKRILVVDDAEDNRNLVRLYLKKFPYLIDMAENGLESVEKYKLSDYDLILMDIQMPVMDGYTAIKEIKEIEKIKGKHTPLIVFTANALESNKEESYKAGCDDYLVKPVQKKELLSAISKYLGNS